MKKSIEIVNDLIPKYNLTIFKAQQEALVLIREIYL